MGVRAGQGLRAELRRAVGGRELALWRAQENHGAGDVELLGSLVQQGLQRGLVDRPEPRAGLGGPESARMARGQQGAVPEMAHGQ
jgi:hypothetical protein